MTQHYKADVVVVGAGLVGLTSAIMSAQQQKTVVLLDTQIKPIKTTSDKNTDNNITPDWDARVYALTPASEQWLQSLGAWDWLDKARVSAINAMHLWSKNNINPLILKDSDANLTKLGLIVENNNLLQALWQQVHALGITVLESEACTKLENIQHEIVLHLSSLTTITAKLLVAADGVNSWVRAQANIGVTHKSFNQTAIVANFLAEKPHGNIARQWFASHNILALLPLPQQMVSMVWSVSTEKATQLLALADDALAQSVLEQSQGALGKLTLVGIKQSYLLSQQTANNLIANRVVFIGDCAHQIHPMAGQGVNLGFRDVMKLQQLTTNVHAMIDIGEQTFLRQYERSRRADIASINALTSSLDSVFASEHQLLNIVTDWGFKQLNEQSTAKKLLIKQATA